LSLAEPAPAVFESALLAVAPVSTSPDAVNAYAMSLNGLDEAAVVEAYQAALAEAGGWQVAPMFLRVDRQRLTLSRLQVPAQIRESRHGRAAGKRNRRRERGKAGS
jgi:hypothetical protein